MTLEFYWNQILSSLPPELSSPRHKVHCVLSNPYSAAGHVCKAPWEDPKRLLRNSTLRRNMKVLSLLQLQLGHNPHCF